MPLCPIVRWCGKWEALNTPKSDQMDNQHRATDDEWACIKENKSEISFSAIHELLCRIQALEAGGTTAQRNC